MTDFDLQQKLAEQRRQQYAHQAQFGAPQGQMVGRHYVAPNALQYLAAGLRSIGGMRGQDLAEQELKQLGEQRTQGNQKALAEFLRQSQGTPEQKTAFEAPAFDEQDAQFMGQQGMSKVTPAVAPNPMAAYAALLQAPSAEYQQMGLRGMAEIPQLAARQQEREDERLFKQQEREATSKDRADAAKFANEQKLEQLRIAHEQRMEYLKQNNADRAAMAAEQRAFQASMAAQSRAFSSAMAGAVGGQKPPSGYRFKDDGTLEPIPGGPASGKDGQKPLTEGQAKGTLYLGQMRSASTELDKLPKVSPVSTAMTGSTYTNWAAPKEAQKVAQLQNQWAESYLRAKTGAAATQGEVDLNKRTFFPVVGDSAAVIEQKKQMRRQAEKDMEATAGPGAATAGTPPAQSAPTGMPQGFRVVR